DVVEGVPHRRGGERGAVGEGDAVTQGEGEGRGVRAHLPVGGEPGDDLPGRRVLVDEGGDELPVDVVRVVPRASALRVEADGVVGEGERQGAAVERAGGGPRRVGAAGGAAGGEGEEGERGGREGERARAAGGAGHRGSSGVGGSVDGGE